MFSTELLNELVSISAPDAAAEGRGKCDLTQTCDGAALTLLNDSQ